MGEWIQSHLGEGLARQECVLDDDGGIVCRVDGRGPYAASIAGKIAHGHNSLESLLSRNAKLAAALADIVKANQDHFDSMPMFWQTYDNIAREALEENEKGGEA